MGLKHHTVIFVPHQRAQFRKWRVSNLQIILALGLLVGLGTASTLAFWSFFTSTVNRSELVRLRDENEQLRGVNESFEGRIQKLQTQLIDYEERTRKLAIVAGLETLGANTDSGIGGDDRQVPAGKDFGLGAVEQRTSGLSGRLDQVATRLDDSLRHVSATPAIAPVAGILTSGFGYRRDPITGQRAYHSGLDISAPPGKPVKAAAAGIVVRTDDYGPLGRAVHVSHGFGLVTIYGHLSRVLAKPGQKLERGDIVGLVGNTGRATGYHLHYEVQLNGQSVDPMSYILDAANSPL